MVIKYKGGKVTIIDNKERQKNYVRIGLIVFMLGLLLIPLFALLFYFHPLSISSKKMTSVFYLTNSFTFIYSAFNFFLASKKNKLCLIIAVVSSLISIAAFLLFIAVYSWT
jgi:hypothetical protein